ncbi:MAG: hypothetical protein LBV69_05640, partial [Bacteroidales bacterium]|nr:hypothetical protein [Bacteroidales bacterium]
MNVFRPRVSKKTILLISIILCTFAINTIAQVDGKIRREIKERNLSKDMLTNEQFFNEAEFIIEGKIVPQQHYSYDGKGEYNPKDIYTMNKFVVSYIYKGDKLLIKVNDTIVLVKNRGTIYKKTPNKYSSTMFDYKAVYSWGEREPSEGYDDIGLYIEPDLPSVLFCKKSDYP